MGIAVMRIKSSVIVKALVLTILMALFFSMSGCYKQTLTEDSEIILAAGRDLSPGYKDPYFSTVILKTWEPLIAISDNGNLEAKLAESWESNEARTEWLFHLRQGVNFQDRKSVV